MGQQHVLIINAGLNLSRRTMLRGSHQGEFQGLAPTGKLVTMRAINIDRIAHGQVVEHWVATYSPSLLQQLTAPTPEQSSGR